MPKCLDKKGRLLYNDNITGLFESYRRTDGAFRIADAIAIDGSCSIVYAGSMEGLGGAVWRKGCISGGYMKFVYGAAPDEIQS